MPIPCKTLYALGWLLSTSVLFQTAIALPGKAVLCFASTSDHGMQSGDASPQQAVHQQSFEGTVTLDGKPLESGVVIQFTPVDGSGPGVETMIENGKFKIDSESNGKFKIELKSKQNP